MSEKHIEETDAYKKWIEIAEELVGHILLTKEIDLPENGSGAHAIACQLVMAEEIARAKALDEVWQRAIERQSIVSGAEISVIMTEELLRIINELKDQ